MAEETTELQEGGVADEGTVAGEGGVEDAELAAGEGGVAGAELAAGEGAGVHASAAAAAGAEPPLVSVIIPVYNAQEYLQGCIDSVLLQTYQNFELICVNDGSTDSSAQILAKAAQADARITVLEQQNAGPGVARNAGIDAARGHYLLFLDADDYWRPELIEHTVARAQETGADVVAFNYRIFNQQVGLEYDPDWTLVASRYPAGAFNWKANPEPLFFTFENLPWNKLFRAAFIRENGIRYQEIYLTEDLLFSGSALVWADKIACLDERLMVRREDIGTNIMAGKDRHPYDFIEAFATFREKLVQRADFAEIEPAYRYWAGSSLTYNLLTLNEADTFMDVFDALRMSGLERMGLSKAPVRNPFDAQVISFIRQDKPVDLLFYVQKIRANEAKAAQFRHGELLERHTAEQRQHADAQRALEGQLADMTAWRDGLQHDHDELWGWYNDLNADHQRVCAELASLTEEHNRMASSAEQRVGQALCKLPRAIQRAGRKE